MTYIFCTVQICCGSPAQLTLFGLNAAATGGGADAGADADAAEREARRAAVHVGERVWLPHKGGYAAARLLPNDSAHAAGAPAPADGEQKCRVRVEFSGEELVVNDVLEKVRLALLSCAVFLLRNTCLGRLWQDVMS